MIPRSGNFNGNFLLLVIKWRLRSSFYIANRYKFLLFCLFVRFFLYFCELLVTWILYSKGKQLSRKMFFFGKKSFRKGFLPLTYPRAVHVRPRKRNHEHAQPRNLKNFYFGNVKKKGGF